MPKLPTGPVLTLAALLAGLAPLLAAAQQAGAPAPAATTQAPPGVVATTGNPNLAAATVKLEQGWRLSKVIGSPVHTAGNERIGTVSDLVVTEGDRVTVAVIATGGFLGMGAKLVAVPWSQLKPEADRVVLPGVTAETLNGMPTFTY